jgi:outer membrane immunogenic protein
MNRYFGLALASVVSLGIGGLGAASAADMAVKAPVYKAPPPVAVFGWNGWYAGVNGGYAWGNSTGNLNAFSTTPAIDNFGPAVAGGGTPSFLGAKHEGGFGGAQVGYNWLWTNWLLGAEADIQGAGIGQTSTVVFPGGGGIVPSVSTGRDHLNWFGTVRGRAGFVANSVLFYGTGGFAYGGVNTSVTNVFTPGTAGTFAGSSSGTRVGWAAGAGVEWGFAPNWSVKGEYLHVDLGSSNTTILDPVNFPGAFATYRFHHDLDTVRVGVNYHFAGPVVAKY